MKKTRKPKNNNEHKVGRVRPQTSRKENDMALHWNFDEKVGTLTAVEKNGKEYELGLYEGNAELIILWEYKNEKGEDMWQMYGFFADKEHMKRCLGLAKGYDNSYDHVTKLRINKARHSDWKNIVTAFARALDNITIEIYNEK